MPLSYPRLAAIVATVVATILAFSIPASATSYVVPTTTLAAQTANNTSAANAFSSQTNGNRGAGNISKGDVHSLLYSGATTRIYAHLLLWFGESKHMNIGYSSTDPAQIQRQIDDMVSRGINGVIIDWYGPNNAIDQATKLVMAEAEKHSGFTFAIMIDEGAIEWDSCSGCSPQQALVSQLQYIEQQYFPSPAYMTEQGQPVVTNFNLDLLYAIDWDAASNALSNHPFFLFQNNSGFNHILSSGSYSWVMPTTTDYGVNYLSSFYNDGTSFPSEQTVGATYKGFNDTLASWGSNRIMGQQCGQTWLRTFSEINTLYNAGKQLPDLQLVTWNDYEEATEIESGIDNCFSLSPSITGNALQWAITGDESTIDHYTAYISADGQNLMSLTSLAAGVHSLNLCSFPISSGSYTLFVQAVGKPSLANQMAGPITYSPACGAVTPPTFTLSASPSTLKISAGMSANLTVTAMPQSGPFNNLVSLSCGALPAGWHCLFSPAGITPASNPALSTLTISNDSASSDSASSDSTTAANLHQRRNLTALSSAWLLPFGIVGFALIGNRPNRHRTRLLTLCAVLGLGLVVTSCGGKVSATHINPAPFNVTINGDSTAGQFSTTVNVTIQ